MANVSRWLGSIGYACTGLLIVQAYAKGVPPGLIETMAVVLACGVTAVWVWRDDT